MNINSLTRRKVRYWLFRKQKELVGGPKATGAPRGLFKRFEEDAVFQLAGGYPAFADNWDLDASDKFKIVPRDISVQDEWAEHLETAVKDLPDADLRHSK